MTDWQTMGRDPWVVVASTHARLRPCAPARVPVTAKARRELIAAILGIAPGQKVVAFSDYAGRTISQDAAWLCSKMAKDEGHTAYVGWIAKTLRDPIEAWDRMENGIARLHYYSAYRAPETGVVSYIAVAASESGILVTAFQKSSARAIDGKREGSPVFCCY